MTFDAACNCQFGWIVSGQLQIYYVIIGHLTTT